MKNEQREQKRLEMLAMINSNEQIEEDASSCCGAETVELSDGDYICLQCREHCGISE